LICDYNYIVIGVLCAFTTSAILNLVDLVIC